MPRFYFHRRSNGLLARDPRGLLFNGMDAACAHAVQRTPTTAGKFIRPEANTCLGTEVPDGTRSLRVARGSVIKERGLAAS